MLILNLLWYFVIFSFCGWVINGIRTLFEEKRFYNKGFLASPFCPSYGVGAVICYLALNHFQDNKFILFFGSCVILSLVVVLIGFLTEKALGFKPWDFSDMKFNIGSYITLPYSLLLGIMGTILVGVLIPILNSVIELIPFLVSLIVVLSICLLILIDYVFAIITTLRLQHRIKKLNGVSSLLGDDVPQEKIDELESNYNKLFTENIMRRRLVSAFPELKNTAYVKQIAAKLDEIKTDNMKEYTQVYENKSDEPFAFGFCFTKLFYLFLFGSMLGTLFETIWALFAEGHFEIRVGMVYGPFIPVYGGGACFLTAVLYKLYKLSDTLIFVISAVVGAGFEYFCSWFQETLFGTVSWDYSNTAFNLDGRTNLMYALIWGFLGLVWVRYLYPWASKLIERIPKRAGSIITTFLIIFMVFNAFMSVSATYRWTQRDDGVPASNSFEEYLDKHFDDDKMNFLFPHMQDVNDTGITSQGLISSERQYETSNSDYTLTTQPTE
ncbi:putative ABC transporter permease [Ruminococcus sp.]|uniref:putative ABC transporter permease n=1 Tax=Ruminococcus sp. TaxID=41978 RepID=UPI00261A615C|nr:putative ABC transporter permease [Ruminococcus sp.]MDD6989905.1 putative ABC transporter permease [Ruminococcus sp.]MDY6201061.1 putative ABC transporter permease [Ruminococcus sp.]